MSKAAKVVAGIEVKDLTDGRGVDMVSYRIRGRYYVEGLTPVSHIKGC